MMAGKSNEFPVYIKAEYDGGDPFETFTRHLESATSNAKRQFGAAFRDIETSVSSALSKPLNASGALNLDPAKMKAAADAAKINALALKEVAAAAERVARTDPSEAFRRTANEATNAANVAERYSQSVAQQALVMDRLQMELDQTKSATIGLASAQRGVTGSLGAQRQASIGAGQQLQDLVISLGSGQRASTVFAQQLPQLAFALSNVGGRVGSIATLFAGPWGVALAAGAFALGPLIDNLFKTEEAADGVKFATNAMGEAQGFLASVLDLTTGKITTQSQALQGLAKAQLLVAQVNAQTRAAEAKRGVQDIQSRGLRFSGGIGGGFSVSRRPTDARDVISQQVLAGNMTSKVAVERLDNLRLAGKLTDDQFASAAASVANLGVELENLKVFGEATKLLDGTGGKSLLKPTKPKTAPAARKGDGGAASLAEFGEDVAKRIANISGQFGDAPTAIVRVNKALRELDDIQSDLERRKPAGLSKMLEDIKSAKGVIEESLTRPLRELVEQSQQQAAIDELVISGKQAEANLLGKVLALKDRGAKIDIQSVQTIGDIVADEQRRTLELDKQREIQQRQLAIIEQTGDNIRSTIGDLLDGKGSKAFGNLISNQFKIIKESLTDDLFESLFGDVFRDQKLKILGLDKVDEAGKEMAKRVTDTVNELQRFTNALAGTTDTILGKMPANDNSPASGQTEAEIIVNGFVNRDSNLAQTLATTLEKVFAINGGASRSIARAIEGGFEGAALGGFVGSAFGGKGGKIGQAAGGLLGSVNSLLGANSPLSGIMAAMPQVGAVLQASSAFSSLLGNDQVKGGKTFGPIAPILTALFGSSLRGSAVIGGQGGSLGVTRTTGNSSSRKSASSSNANTIIDQINSIAEQLGATVNASLGSVSVGLRKKQYLIDPTGQGRTKGSGVIKFGEGEEGQLAAARAAALDLINDGVIQGLRAGSQRLLANAKSLEDGLSKALSFQSVFDRLKQKEDPVGFALDTVDREFTRLRNIFMEAGASSAEYADLEKLYGLERAEAFKAASEQVSASLKDFYNSLTAGNDARSLKERQEAALKEFDPLAARVAAGDKTAYDEFAQIAQQLLDIERQIYGSQAGYFTRLNQVTDLTKTRVDADSNVSMITDMRPGIFGSSSPNNDTAPVINAIMGGNADLLAALNLSNQINLQNGEYLKMVGNGGSRVVFGEAQRQYY